MTRHFTFSLVAVLVLSACTTQMKWFGASGNECEWDEINYKDYYRDSPASSGQAGGSDVPAFGACSDQDLANSTCK